MNMYVCILLLEDFCYFCFFICFGEKRCEVCEREEVREGGEGEEVIGEGSEGGW